MHFCIFPKTAFCRWRFLKRWRADFPWSLSTRFPQLRWIAGGAEEYLLDTDDSEAVSSQLEAALGRVDRSDREGRRGKIEAFSWTRIAERYRGFFREILELNG